MKLINGIKKLSYLSKKNFSIIHNYYSPYILWSEGNYIEYDDNLTEYNPYFQAFLNKRRIHKKEIRPKILILKDKYNILKEYHNTFYIQNTYPCYNLINYQYMKYLHKSNIIDSTYIISRFSEEYEKPMLDAALTKTIVCGRVEFLEDYEFFSNLKKQIKHLIQIFYHGEKLSAFEREIERAYLMIKKEKFSELQAKYQANPNLKRSECFFTFSEKNRSYGHINFRMSHPNYFFQPRPIFEKINFENIFNSLYEIRYNILKSHQIFKKLLLKFHYRKSLIYSPTRTEFVSNYIYVMVFQYLESYEFYSEFNLSLNFKENFNLIILHFWMIIIRLKSIKMTDNQNAIYCDQIITNILDKLVNYYKQNINNFLPDESSIYILNIELFLKQLLDVYTFNIEYSSLCLLTLKNLLNEIIFKNSFDKDDKYLKKLTYYVYIHQFYFKTKNYKDFEACDFDFSVNKIPINYLSFFPKTDEVGKIGHLNYSSKIQELKNLINNEINHLDTQLNIDNHIVNTVECLINNYESQKNLYFIQLQNSIHSDNKIEIFKKIVNSYLDNPYNKLSNFGTIDKNNKFYKLSTKLQDLISEEHIKNMEKVSNFIKTAQL